MMGFFVWLKGLFVGVVVFRDDVRDAIERADAVRVSKDLVRLESLRVRNKRISDRKDLNNAIAVERDKLFDKRF